MAAAPFEPPPKILSEAETIDLFHNAIYTAREEQVPNGKGSDFLPAKGLTLDFKRTGLGALPKEAVDIIKRDVGL